jgi:hypothetical protein
MEHANFLFTTQRVEPTKLGGARPLVDEAQVTVCGGDAVEGFSITDGVLEVDSAASTHSTAYGTRYLFEKIFYFKRTTVGWAVLSGAHVRGV